MQESGDHAVNWGSLARINAGLAESKGLGRSNWFLLSLMLEPVATILIVASERAKRAA